MAKKILLVDDEVDMLELTRMRLENAGYEVITSNTGEDALEIMKLNRPDLVLIDLLLPKMQGAEVCSRIRNDEKLKNLPIILFTAKSGSGPAETRRLMANDYISKPFDSENLLEKIKKFI